MSTNAPRERKDGMGPPQYDASAMPKKPPVEVRVSMSHILKEHDSAIKENIMLRSMLKMKLEEATDKEFLLWARERLYEMYSEESKFSYEMIVRFDKIIETYDGTESEK